MSSILSVFPKDQVVTPDDGTAYDEATHRWAGNAERRAKFVVYPRTAQDVATAIKYAVDNGLELAIKGGGHSCSGASSSEGLVIDMRDLAAVSVETENQLITVGGGAVWEAVDKEAAKYGLATVGGTVNHTGVGGLTLGGGYGWLTPKYGLVIDNLVKAEIVTASGDILICSATENQDLFWAIKGAGSNFGVVTYFVLKAYPQPNTVWSGLVIFTPPQLEAVSKAATTWLQTASADESAMIFIACPPPTFQPAIALLPFFNGSAEEGHKRFSAFFDVGPVADLTKELPYDDMNSLQNPMATHGDRKILKSACFSQMDNALVQAVFQEYVKLTEAHPETKASAILFELHGHAKLMSVPADSASFANRGPFYNMTMAMRWKEPALDAVVRTWATTLAKSVRAYEDAHSTLDLSASRGYSNYGIGDERVRDVFGTHYDRLAEIKARYDPGMVFKKWFPITPKA